MDEKLTPPRRSSILKQVKQRTPFQEINPAEQTSDDLTKRVSFATKSSIKPFIVDGVQNTIWDTTYEEAVCHEPSTSPSTKSSISAKSVNATVINEVNMEFTNVVQFEAKTIISNDDLKKLINADDSMEFTITSKNITNQVNEFRNCDENTMEFTKMLQSNKIYKEYDNTRLDSVDMDLTDVVPDPVIITKLNNADNTQKVSEVDMDFSVPVASTSVPKYSKFETEMQFTQVENNNDKVRREFAIGHIQADNFTNVTGKSNKNVLTENQISISNVTIHSDTSSDMELTKMIDISKKCLDVQNLTTSQSEMELTLIDNLSKKDNEAPTIANVQKQSTLDSFKNLTQIIDFPHNHEKVTETTLIQKQNVCSNKKQPIKHAASGIPKILTSKSKKVTSKNESSNYNELCKNRIVRSIQKPETSGLNKELTQMVGFCDNHEKVTEKTFTKTKQIPSTEITQAENFSQNVIVAEKTFTTTRHIPSIEIIQENFSQNVVIKCNTGSNILKHTTSDLGMELIEAGEDFSKTPDKVIGKTLTKTKKIFSSNKKSPKRLVISDDSQKHSTCKSEMEVTYTKNFAQKEVIRTATDPNIQKHTTSDLGMELIQTREDFSKNHDKVTEKTFIKTRNSNKRSLNNVAISEDDEELTASKPKKTIKKTKKLSHHEVIKKTTDTNIQDLSNELTEMVEDFPKNHDKCIEKTFIQKCNNRKEFAASDIQMLSASKSKINVTSTHMTAKKLNYSGFDIHEKTVNDEKDLSCHLIQSDSIKALNSCYDKSIKDTSNLQDSHISQESIILVDSLSTSNNTTADTSICERKQYVITPIKINHEIIDSCDKTIQEATNKIEMYKKKLQILHETDLTNICNLEKYISSKKYLNFDESESTVNLSDTYVSEDSSSKCISSDSKLLTSSEEESSYRAAIKTKIEELATRNDKVWFFVDVNEGTYNFKTLFGTIKFSVTLTGENGVVSNIEVKQNISATSEPIGKYLCNIFTNKLKYQTLKSALGNNFDIVSLLDYINLTYNKVQLISDEYDQYRFNRNYCLEMDDNFKVTFKIYNLKLMLIWIITVDMSQDDITEDCITASAKLGTVKETDIKKLIRSCPKGFQFLGCFISNIKEYVKSLERIRKVV